MSKPIITMTVPTFFLRGVDPTKIVEKYQSGAYENLDYNTEKVKICPVKPTFQPSFGTNINDGVFTLRLPNNSTQIIATTNQEIWVKHLNSNDDSIDISGLTCEYCRQDITGTPVGIPVKMATTKHPDGHDVYVFGFDRVTCDLECSLALIHQENRNRFPCRDPLYRTSEQMLRYLHRLLYPQDPPLRRAADYRLHLRNGGSLDDSQYYTSRHRYIRTPNVISGPVKIMYVREEARSLGKS